jgi:hypothetical protein
MKHDEKRCTKCKTVKSSSEFYNRKAALDGLTSWCKECKVIHGRAKRKEWFDKNRDSRNKKQREWYQKNREATLKQQRGRYASDSEYRDLCILREKARKVGLSVEMYQQTWDHLYSLQVGCCGICGRHASEIQLVMDHRHSDMLIRGLLCGNCNTALGMLGDDPIRVKGMLQYLK